MEFEQSGKSKAAYEVESPFVSISPLLLFTYKGVVIAKAPFPWLISDFGLVDVIESGIVKIRRLPVSATTGRPEPKYFVLWKQITDNLQPGERLPGGKPKPEVVWREAEDALSTLASQCKERFDYIQQATPDKEHTPPMLIIVCDNTDIAELFYKNISGEEMMENVEEDEEDEEEAVDVYGIPFSIIPFKGRETKKPAPEDKPKNHIRTLPERQQFAIRFPVVEGYAFALQRYLIKTDIEAMEPLILEPARTLTAVFVKPQVGYQLGPPRHHLFPQVYRLVREYVARKIQWHGCHPCELGVETDDHDRAKHQATQRWVATVNHWGQLGHWAFHVYRDPKRLGQELLSFI